MHGKELGQFKPADLAQREVLRLATLAIDPATRRVTGPTGSAVLRPQVMLVLLTLADAKGAVVSRDDLTLRAWSGRFVAEDSLNGAISEIRRAFRTAGAQGVELLTIPKTGYRLASPEDAVHDLSASQDIPPRTAIPSHRGTRRWALAGGGAALLGGIGVWSTQRPDSKQRAEDLIDRGLIALRQGLPDPRAQGVAAFEEATRLEPANARAWGLLALSLKWAAEYESPDRVEQTRYRSEAAARRALALDPRQADALTALALLTPSFGRWLEAERRLRAILAIDPENRFATSGLSNLFMSTGQVRKSLASLDRQVARDPLSPNLQFRRVYTLWSAGRLAEADATADRALQSWPRHPAVWFARFWTFAFTGRAERAGAMLNDRAARPEIPPQWAELLALSVAALAKPEASAVALATRANIDAAGRGPVQAIGAIMVLSMLGAGAAALDVARGFLIHRGQVIVQQRHSEQQPSITDQHHRMTMMLWIPATQALRQQQGFAGLCDEIGLADYWRAAGVRPDLPIGPDVAERQQYQLA